MRYDIKCKKQDFVFKEKITSDLKMPEERYGFSEVLNTQRNKIDKIDTDVWKKVRWYINDYDFLVKDPIINRAFYKYWEIINEFGIFENYKDTDIIFHCAEAPGGFIQGSNIYLQLENKIIPKPKIAPLVDNDGFTAVKSKRKEPKEYKIFTISLNRDLSQYRSYNLPSYNKSILNKHISIVYGRDNTGDINNLDNIDWIANKSGGSNKFFLITADGGFDEGNDFNNKEQLHYFLILNEIYSAITLQKRGGSFILKVFDIFTETSIQLLFLLNTLYDSIFVYKPKTSRPTNSEKYIICKNFNPPSTAYLDKIKLALFNLSKNLRSRNMKYATFSLFEKTPEDFIKKIQEMNTIFIKAQCDFLEKAIMYCDNTEFIKNYDIELSNSIEKRKAVFREWEKKYNLDSYIPS
jgi:23S rRNA U2552 (ribose-2'-O)-methylase RlmE/FtsJ